MSTYERLSLWIALAMLIVAVVNLHKNDKK